MNVGDAFYFVWYNLNRGLMLVQHYTVFSLALGQILREYAVSELNLTLNAGNWNYDRWGYPEEKGVGTGAELWAWMGQGTTTWIRLNLLTIETVSNWQIFWGNRVDDRWKGFWNALAGLFCASLGSLDDLRTTSPAQSFPPEGTLPDWGLPHQVRHASLPSEHVCTENLTPFLKLLPCKSLSGIASLLNPHRLFDADEHGMGVHVLWRTQGGRYWAQTYLSVCVRSFTVIFGGSRSVTMSNLTCVLSLIKFRLVSQVVIRPNEPSNEAVPWHKQVISLFLCPVIQFILSNLWPPHQLTEMLRLSMWTRVCRTPVKYLIG